QDEHDVADVHDRTSGLSENEDRVAPVQGVDEERHASRQAQVPERHGDDALARALAVQPLHDETGREERLSRKTDREPGDRLLYAVLEAHSLSSLPACGATWRRISQRTPNRSTMPTHSRFPMPYLERPAWRGRCATGSATIPPPAARTSAGRK